MMKRLFIPLSAALLCACVPRAVTVRATADLIENGISAIYEESDPRFAREAMPGQLMLTEVLLKNDPDNFDLLQALAEGYFGYAFLFLDEDEPERAAGFYRRAASYGLRLLARNKKLAGLEQMNVEEMTDSLAAAGADDVPGLYWTASAWAGRANLMKNDAASLTAVPKAARLMQRVLELDAAYQFGGADLFFGVYYAGRPRMAGGDPETGKKHFEAVLKRNERRYLMAQLLYAKYYSVAALDEEGFKSLLAEIGSAAADALPAAALPNAVARNKSKKLLEQLNDLF